MTEAEIPRCDGPACSRPLVPRSTGRPGRYCSATCRQGAYRDRARRAEQERRRAGDLADARRAVALLWPRVEAAGLDVGEIAERVVSYAAEERPEDRGALVLQLGELRRVTDRLERLALDFRRADELAEALIAAAGTADCQGRTGAIQRRFTGRGPL
jgi:hypothetical protein